MSDGALGKTRLRLYVTGGTARAHRAIAVTRRLCDQAFGDAYDLAIVDVLDQPELAERDRVAATPTLIREFPPPVRRIVGDPGTGEAVRTALDLPIAGSASADAGA